MPTAIYISGLGQSANKEYLEKQTYNYDKAFIYLNSFRRIKIKGVSIFMTLTLEQKRFR
jgi:hypothetical protein